MAKILKINKKGKHQILIKKTVIGFDENYGYCDLAFGYSNRKEAIKAIAKISGLHEREIDVRKVRVKVFKDENGEDYYFWGKECKHCGSKNKDGIISYVSEC